MAQKKSNKMKKFFHMAYSIGASIVILGALGKILHTSIFGIPGDVLLMIGLGTEAVIFFISALSTISTISSFVSSNLLTCESIISP
jgi:hypothetical protein